MIATVTIPPGDPGSGPHRHSGPVFGYVLEGEILFELEGERPYPIKAGEAFWEPGFEVVHYQAANLRTDIASKFVVFMLCAPDVPMMTYLDEAEITSGRTCGARPEAEPAIPSRNERLRRGGRRPAALHDPGEVGALPHRGLPGSGRAQLVLAPIPPCRPRWPTTCSPTSWRSPSRT